MRRLASVGLLVLLVLGPPSFPGAVRADGEAEQTLFRLLALAGEARSLDGQGRYAEAFAKADEALRLSERALGPNHTATVTTRILVGQILIRLGRYEESRGHLERALTDTGTLSFVPPVVRATATYDLGVALLHLEEYTEAGRVLTDAHAKLLGIYEEEHAAPAACLVSLGKAVAAQGDPEEGLRLCDEGLATLRRAVGETDMRIAVSLSNQGLILESLGRHEEARASYEAALALHAKAKREEHPEAILTTGNLARLLYHMEDYAEARSLYERVLAYQQEHLGPEHPDVTYTLGNLGALLDRQGHPEEGLALVERAVNVSETSLGLEHPQTRLAQSNLASALLARGRFEEAAAVMTRCLDSVEQSVRRRLVSMRTDERIRLAASQRGYLVNWWRLLAWRGESGYEEVLRFKGLIRRVMAAERRLARGVGEEGRVRVDEVRSVERTLARLANAIPRRSHQEERRAWETSWEEATARRDRLAAALAGEFAPFREGLERLDLSLQEVRARLKPDEVLLDYLVTGDIYQVWVVPPEGEARRVELAPTERIEEAAARFGALSEREDTTLDDAEWLAAGQRLRDLVLAPALSLVPSDTNTLYVSPDAALAVVPLAALPGEATGRFLLDEYLLVQVTMAQDLVPWTGTEPPGSGALVIGDVDYAEAAANPAEVPVLPGHGGTASRGGRTWTLLPETAAEARFVAGRFPSPDTTVLTGMNATEARFRSAAPGRYAIHVASHGYTDPEGILTRALERWSGARGVRRHGLDAARLGLPDPLLLAGLVLAGANGEDGAHGDDGHLTALEVSHLDLDGVRLVVLSACETALGQTASGEGVLGLVQAFQVAGAGPVLGSLWKVDDAATRLLVQHFYERLSASERGPAAALRDAQRHLRDTAVGADGKLRFSAPRHWAAWSLWSVAAPTGTPPDGE